MRRLALFFCFFFLSISAFSENEKLGFSLGTEGGTIYKGTAVSGELNFFNSYRFKNNKNLYLENFCGLQVTNKCIDFTNENICFFLEKEKVSLGSGFITHFDFLYGIDFEYDLLLNLKSIFGKKNALYNCLLELNLSHKGMVIYSLPVHHKYLFENGFGLNFCNIFNFPDEWTLNFGFRTWEHYKYSAPLNFTLYVELEKKFLEHYEITTGIYFRYLDQNSTTAYLEYPAFRLGFIYIF